MKTKQKERIIKSALPYYEIKLDRDLKLLSKRADAFKRFFNKATKETAYISSVGMRITEEIYLNEISKPISSLLRQKKQVQILIEELSDY